MSEPKKYDIFLPKTDFPMRGNLPQAEPQMLKHWQESGLYDKIRKGGEGKKPWVLHWGPPYANGNIHIGHAFTKSLKDIVNRFMQMGGNDCPLIPGWDCHGLPIEWKVEEEYRKQGKSKDNVLEFRASCRDFARKWVDVQRDEMKRLGVSANWDNPYLTMDNKTEAAIVGEIYKFLNNGLLYRGEKPIMWSSVEKTALAEAEVEYKEHKSTALWVKFPIIKAADESLIGANIVIWTTTPWTIPANRAIAFGANIEYGLYEDEDGQRLVVANSLAKETYKKISDIKGFQDIVCAHPLASLGYDFEVPLFDGDFVTNEAGTGFVHIAPAHGADDNALGRKYNLPVECCVDDDGYYTDKHGAFAGKRVFGLEVFKDKESDADIAVIIALAAAGAIAAKASFRHDYPHSWRSGAPVLFRTTPQWFVPMDGAPNLRKTALCEINKVKWVPSQGQNRITAMVEGRPDWCISRQRAWGVPIALFVNKKSGEVLKDKDVQQRVICAFEKEGADAWWSRDAGEFLGDKYTKDDYEQIFDIVDVWLDSGASHAYVLEERGLPWPADLYLEGSDQHRGWFQSSLLEACATRGKAPYKAVLTHGFILDEKGYKMSKSKGNVIAPADLMQKYGADIVRLWAITVDYTKDVQAGAQSFKSAGDIYRRLRNTLRFLLGALDGFSNKERVETKDMPQLERYILSRLCALDEEIKECKADYNFGEIAHKIHHFCNADLSSFYFDIRKDALYCDDENSLVRRSLRTVFAHLFDFLVTRLAPILVFTTEQAWKYRPNGVFEEADSVHLRTFSQTKDVWRDDVLEENWNKLRELRSLVLAEIEPKRKDKQIGSSLEASINITAPKSWRGILDGIDVADLCIVSSASISFDENASEVTAEFTHAKGDKCQRCWKILPSVKGDLCPRCASAV